MRTIDLLIWIAGAGSCVGGAIYCFGWMAGLFAGLAMLSGWMLRVIWTDDYCTEGEDEDDGHEAKAG